MKDYAMAAAVSALVIGLPLYLAFDDWLIGYGGALAGVCAYTYLVKVPFARKLVTSLVAGASASAITPSVSVKLFGGPTGDVEVLVQGAAALSTVAFLGAAVSVYRSEPPTVNSVDLLDSDEGPRLRAAHSIPRKKYSRFVGRERDLQELAKRLQALGSLNVRGHAGSGKTTLAIEYAYRSAASNRYERIVWQGAITRVLDSGDVLPPGGSTGLEDLLFNIAELFGIQDLEIQDIDSRVRRINSALAKLRTLLIVDNYETIRDERVADFLLHVPESVSVLLTGTESVDGFDEFWVDEFDAETSRAFSAYLSERKSVPVSATEIDSIYDLSSGLPLAIEWLFAQASEGLTIASAMEAFADSEGDLLKFLFERSLDQLVSEDHRRVLYSLCLNPGDASRSLLHEMALPDAQQLDLDTIVLAIARLGLCRASDGDRVTTLPVIRRFVGGRDLLSGDELLQLRLRQVEWFEDFLRNQSPRQESTPDPAVFFRELENVNDCQVWIQSSGRVLDHLDFLVGLTSIYWSIGQYDELFSMADSIDAGLVPSSEAAKAAHILLMATLSAMDQRKPERMRTYLHQAEGFLKLTTESSRLREELSETFEFSSAVLAFLDGSPDVEERLRENLACSEALGESWRIGGTLYWLGIISFVHEDWSAAIKHFSSVVTVCQPSGDRRTQALAAAYLPIPYYQLGKSSETRASIDSSTDQLVNVFGQRTSKARYALSKAEILTAEAMRLAKTSRLRQSKRSQGYRDVFSSLEPVARPSAGMRRGLGLASSKNTRDRIAELLGRAHQNALEAQSHNLVLGRSDELDRSQELLDTIKISQRHLDPTQSKETCNEAPIAT